MKAPDPKPGIRIRLSPEDAEIVNKLVARGDFATPLDVVWEAVRRLAEDRRQIEAQRQKPAES